MNAHSQKRLQQISDRLAELSDASITPGITRSQRSAISAEMRELLKERENLEENRNHWLAETQPSMGDVVALVRRELGVQRKISR